MNYSNYFKAIYFAATILYLFSCSEENEPIEEQREIDLNISVFSDRENSSNTRAEAAIFSPSGGRFSPGQSTWITWDFLLCGCDWSASKIHIDLYRGGSYLQRIASNVDFFNSNSPEGTGGYQWTIPSYLSVGSNYQIKITSVSYSSDNALSGFFTIQRNIIQNSEFNGSSNWSLYNGAYISSYGFLASRNGWGTSSLELVAKSSIFNIDASLAYTFEVPKHEISKGGVVKIVNSSSGSVAHTFSHNSSFIYDGIVNYKSINFNSSGNYHIEVYFIPDEVADSGDEADSYRIDFIRLKY